MFNEIFRLFQVHLKKYATFTCTCWPLHKQRIFLKLKKGGAAVKLAPPAFNEISLLLQEHFLTNMEHSSALAEHIPKHYYKFQYLVGTVVSKELFSIHLLLCRNFWRPTSYLPFQSISLIPTCISAREINLTSVLPTR